MEGGEGEKMDLSYRQFFQKSHLQSELLILLTCRLCSLHVASAIFSCSAWRMLEIHCKETKKKEEEEEEEERIGARGVLKEVREVADMEVVAVDVHESE